MVRNRTGKPQSGPLGTVAQGAGMVLAATVRQATFAVRRYGFAALRPGGARGIWVRPCSRHLPPFLGGAVAASRGHRGLR